MRFEAKVLRALTFSKEFVLDDKDGEKPVNDLFLGKNSSILSLLN
jgi:hypothetical protein